MLLLESLWTVMWRLLFLPIANCLQTCFDFCMVEPAGPDLLKVWNRVGLRQPVWFGFMDLEKKNIPLFIPFSHIFHLLSYHSSSSYEVSHLSFHASALPSNRFLDALMPPPFLILYIHLFIAHSVSGVKGESDRPMKQPQFPTPSIHLPPTGTFLACSSSPFPSSPPIILEALDVAVGFQRGEEDVEEPQADEQHGGQDLRSPGPP